MRVPAIASVLLAVLSVAPVFAADVDARKLLAADQKVQVGRKAFDAGDLAEARKQYQKALDLFRAVGDRLQVQTPRGMRLYQVLAIHREKV